MEMEMNRATAFGVGIVFLCACGTPRAKPSGGNTMSTLLINWQRLVDDKGRTCDRCGTTEMAVEDAVQQLKRSLKELNIDVVLEKTEIDVTTFSKDTLQSNRIWIAGEPIEKWLSASSGKSRCCSTCGESDCRTLLIEGKTYEAIPAELIVQAGLMAGARLIQGKSHGTCCPQPQTQSKGSEAPCASPECQKKERPSNKAL